MARLLVSTLPLTGHVHPMLALVRGLAARGHDVHWYAGRKFARDIAAAGASFVPMCAARDWDDSDLERALPALRTKRGLSRTKSQLRALSIDPTLDRLADLSLAVDRLRPDALIADTGCLGAALVSEQRALPWVTLGVSPLIVPSLDTAPFGSALPPARTWLGRARNRLLNWAVLRVLFADVNRHFRRARMAAGMPAGDGSFFDVLSPDLHLQPTIGAFEYPRRDLPPQVRFIGPLLPSAAASRGWTPPPFWAELEAAVARGTPIVLVTQGTVASAASDLIVPALRGLAGEPLLTVATTRADRRELGASELPRNARVAPYIPYERLLPLASAMVTNGGFNGVQLALAHGVPLVVAGGSEDKPEVAARVAWSGIGIDLRTARPGARAVAAAVRKLLAEPRFAQRAQALAAQASACDAPVHAATSIEDLLAAKHAARRLRVQ